MFELEGSFVDTRAADLTLTLDADEQPALATRRGRLGPFDVELRLLGASHQLTVDRRASGLLRETLACLPGDRPHLPSTWVRDDYAFRAEVSVHDDESLSELVDRLRTPADAADSLHLIGSYPGRPLAVTAIRAGYDVASDALRWQTWHTYPQSSEVVYTESALSGRLA
nr:DUF2617 family protein [Gordonia araii]